MYTLCNMCAFILQNYLILYFFFFFNKDKCYFTKGRYFSLFSSSLLCLCRCIGGIIPYWWLLKQIACWRFGGFVCKKNGNVRCAQAPQWRCISESFFFVDDSPAFCVWSCGVRECCAFYLTCSHLLKITSTFKGIGRHGFYPQTMNTCSHILIIFFFFYVWLPFC